MKRQRYPLDHSNIFLLDLCYNESRLPKHILPSWEILSPILSEYGLLEYTVQNRKNWVPQELLSLQKENIKQNTKKNYIFLTLAKEISKTASSKNIQITSLKGISLINRFLDIKTRKMSDIDLLIDKKHNFYFKNLMQSMGFEVLPGIKWKQNDFKESYGRNFGNFNITIEVHNRLFFNEPHDWKWRYIQAKDLYHLANEDLLVHLIGHLGYQHTFLKFFWMLDIIKLLEKKSHCLNFKKVFEISKNLQLNNSTYLTLAWINKFTEIKTPLPPVNDIFLNKLITEDLAFFHCRRLTKHYYIKHLTKDRVSQALSYDIEWIAHKLKQKLAKTGFSQ